MTTQECELCDDQATYVAYVALVEAPPEDFPSQGMMYACGTHIAVLLERSTFMPGCTETWLVHTLHWYHHLIGQAHSHEEGGSMTPTEEETPETEAPEEGEETPETED